ncbi:hypothetical protein [Parabacteroides goldsteinii]|uniref:hypothetical protein n=1 Tax=Parabacteroides goldsteinii TaxID=328812 RepID=UPI0026746418|nr:hypothetical protein [Parabacteroides goldsteinii]
METMKFKELGTGDIFRFINKKTAYLVCYGKHSIEGNNIIQELKKPFIISQITESMMEREVVKYNVNEINYEAIEGGVIMSIKNK